MGINEYEIQGVPVKKYGIFAKRSAALAHNTNPEYDEQERSHCVRGELVMRKHRGFVATNKGFCRILVPEFTFANSRNSCARILANPRHVFAAALKEEMSGTRMFSELL